MALKIVFGSLATDYIAEQGREIKDVAEEIGKTPANQFSKWKTGKWTYINERKLVRVIEVVARKDRQKQINLMIAYLIDMTPEVFRPWIDIVPKLNAEDDSGGLSGKWSPSMRAKLEAIGAAYARDQDFMRMADQVAKWAEGINRRVEG